MDTRRLKAFVTIVDQGSITKAAEILATAQPALSAQVQALERNFGAQLLVRSTHGIELTDAGRMLYVHAQIILKQYETARRDVESAKRELRGMVRLGIPASLSIILGSTLKARLAQENPGITLLMSEGLAGGLMDELTMRQQLDLVLLQDESRNRSLDCIPLVIEEVVLVGQSGLADASPFLSVNDLEALPLILPSGANQLRHVLQRHFDTAGVTPHVIAEVDSIHLLREAAAEGIGWTFLPLALAENRRGAPLTVRRIQGFKVHRSISLASIRPEPVPNEVAAVRSLLIALATGMAESGSWPGTTPAPAH